MYVKKFEAETLEEAIRSVKRELGPDAIILKTVNNSGLRGALRKKVQITAAIKEDDYANKTRVDNVLPDAEKEAFYNSGAEHINEKINSYNSGSYGKMGLNKAVKSVSEMGHRASETLKNGLDDFLSDLKEDEQEYADTITPIQEAPARKVIYHATETVQATQSDRPSYQNSNELERIVNHQKNQIQNLEHKLNNLLNHFEENKKIQKEHPSSIDNLYTTLRTLDLSEKNVQRVIKRLNFELNDEDKKDDNLVYDHALKTIADHLNFSLPRFAGLSKEPVVTVLISDHASGQSSMALRLSKLQKDNMIIKYRNNVIDNDKHDFTSKILDIEVSNVSSLSHIVSECRKQIDLGKSVVIDLKACGKESDETRKFIESLKRSFSNLEVLTVLSAMHTELYNRKILSKYKEITNGAIITYIDMCMNYGSLININTDFEACPFMMFGTGPTIPDDVEEATADRLMAGLLQL